MAKMILEDVCYQYKKTDQQVLNGVSCCFESGDLCAIIGPSGSGKTTLLSLMAGLDLPVQGNIMVNGEKLDSINLDWYRREQISMIFQSFHLFSLLTIMENVCYPMEIRGVKLKDAKSRAAELLGMVGITKEKHKRFPAHLSGGEQQRVAIARALASGAQIILADEPTGNLDQKNTEHILEILCRLAHEKGYCIIVVTHDMQVAKIADHVWRMHNGSLVPER